MQSQLTPQTIGIGVLAGAATTLLCLGLISGSALSVILFFLSPVPLMLVSLGFGLKAALVGTFVAIAGTLAFSAGLVAVPVALSIAAPACASGYWLNLARPAEEIGGPRDALAWYPLADVLFALALFTGVAYSVVGIIVGFGPAVAAQLADEIIARFYLTNPEIAFSPEGRESLRTFLETWVPPAQSFMWMLSLTLSVYITLAIARKSGLVRRPKDDWRLGLRMPRIAIAGLAIAILVSFMPGPAGYVGSSFAGALAAGFLVAGFAVIHSRLRNNPARPIILFLVYFSVVVIGLPALFFFIVGLFSTGRHVPLTPLNASPQSPRLTD
ncbi:DUF2232 domain-containing protein [Oricola thermophila]|uniref:DUF2232 domain-containing protein n=1 Tax=Oricola thermophila TaxID=2742145 RepID=A0A6N1VBP1_9HYPH|nr:DUF2232 domain-containing protein [Oricola thermophila]QKV18431.1 DUF2232 domain-containing protein [Oricola thermophila]